MPTSSDWGEHPDPEEPIDGHDVTYTSPDCRHFANVDEIRVNHQLGEQPRTTVRIRSREILRTGDPLYVDPDSSELTPHAGDRSRAGAGHPVGVVLSVQTRRYVRDGYSVNGMHYEVHAEEYHAEVLIENVRSSPIVLARQGRPPLHVLDTETTAPPCQPFAVGAERFGPSPIEGAMRSIISHSRDWVAPFLIRHMGIDLAGSADQAASRLVRPTPVAQDLKSDDPLEDQV